jgi:DNA-binding beta-propeller fold protein YncE
MRDRRCTVARALGTLVLGGMTLGALAQTPVFVRASDTSFRQPHDLVLSADARLLYVADLGNDVVKVLDAETLATVGEIGRGELKSPHDVALDSQGRLLVADSGNNRIVRYALDGRGGRRVGEFKGPFVSPEGVVAARDGHVYATSVGRDNIAVLVDGKIIAERHDLGLRRPHDVALDAEGRVYVADSGNDRILILDGDLQPLRVLGGAAFGFNEPKYLAFDEHGRLYVADEDNHRIQIFDAQYRRLWVIGSGRAGAGLGELRKPEGVTARGARVWIADTYNNRIVLYRLP